MDRIDALAGHDDARLDTMSGMVLAGELDQELQTIVEELASELHAPIALVSLILRKTQYFRAHFGLPPDLTLTRATDRDVSFCQFVVRDGVRFEVSDAQRDERVPVELVRTYGIRAYIGQPVMIGACVVGSLCAIDMTPREFSEQDRAQLELLASRVSLRLGELARASTHVASAGLEIATRPVFAELRNALTPMILGAGSASVLLAELRVLAASVQLSDMSVLRNTSSHQSLSEAIAELTDTWDDVQDASRRLQAGIVALERTLTGAASLTTLGDILAVSEQLSLHRTRGGGGIDTSGCEPRLRVRVARGTAINAVSSLLSWMGVALSEQQDLSGITLSCQLLKGELLLNFDSVLGEAALDQIWRDWQRIFVDERGLALTREDTRFELRLQA